MKNISNGFYAELEELRSQGMPEASFGFLENVDVGEYYNLYDFLHGHCDEFAAALSDYYGYPVEYIVDSSNVLIHAYCTADFNGAKAYIDARGMTTDTKLFFDEFADFCSYKDGCFYDLKGECRVFRHKNTREMYNDENRILNQDNDLVKFFMLNNSYYDVNLFKEKFLMKTLKDWPEGVALGQYLKVGDKIDTEMYEHFLNLLPPQYNRHSDGVLQVGGACDAVRDEDGCFRNTYLTFVRDNDSDCWVFKGECFSRECINRNPDLEPKGQFNVSVRQTRMATITVEASSRDEALAMASAAVRSDNVDWSDGPLSFTKTVAIEPTECLDDKIKQADAVKNSHNGRTFINSIEKER